MKISLFSPALCDFQVAPRTPESAIKLGGELLLNQNYIESNYIDKILESYHQNGPYFVLAPSIALPHASSKEGVKKAGISFLNLSEPLYFGSEANDPVRIIITLASTDGDEHLKLLQSLSNVLSSKKVQNEMAMVKNFENLFELIGGASV